MESTDSPKKSMILRSRKNLDMHILDMPIDIDEELSNLVTQIEQNTFSILSIKQKFALMKKNGDEFKQEAHSRLDSFNKLIENLENKTLETFDSYSARLDNMEILSFRPSMFHPAKSFTIPTNNEITTISNTDDFIFIGTDISMIFVFSFDTLQKFVDLGPFDNNPITKLCSFKIDTTTYVLSYTNTRTVFISDPNKPAFQVKHNGHNFICWPSSLSCKYKFAIFRQKEIRLFSNSLEQYDTLTLTATLGAGGVDSLVTAYEKTVTVVNFGEEEETRRTFDFNFEITHLTASKSFFCVSGKEEIVICNYEGEKRQINFNNPTSFLTSNEFYIFRIANKMMIEVYDAFGKNKVIYVGSDNWSPHDGHDAPSAACLCDSVIMTGKSTKCVIWSE
ncbi:hypothetical protein TVAG_194810 [Trichomonas vaginalis G3]|uniref:Uncharacterized protein n=1 Tax=Trichomonas vaginalis (strain ATCC PRA-98 / G3) TaxID=412133 RepID=A2FL24_TRIV3|nr:WD40 repeat-like family [Trichomonas vaginalis G3]EAX94395.1 hypothetical protein TVAG_194810 [Trichomonas vaginalis G3]KAI5493991.1 WD40 repeat-like family [Trichomonas vaginalis G3]|eukprot:XP_001307325.1 hypothetical protein [Trichomonas vaginalis G3]